MTWQPRSSQLPHMAAAIYERTYCSIHISFSPDPVGTSLVPCMLQGCFRAGLIPNSTVVNRLPGRFRSFSVSPDILSPNLSKGMTSSPVLVGTPGSSYCQLRPSPRDASVTLPVVSLEKLCRLDRME